MGSGGARTGRKTARQAIPIVLLSIFIALFSTGLFTIAQDGHALSVIDEHIHFDTAVKAGQGEIPYRGSILGPELLEEWACGVGHEGGAIAYPCGDPRVTPDAIPSGKYSTGYGHYPTYFFAAAGFQHVFAAITGSDDLLQGFRVFSALTLFLGVVATAVFGWLLGLRNSRLIAVTAIPVATSMVVFAGTIVNPTSVSVLGGALIGGTGLLWMRRGKGFVWFALSVAFASSVAVTVALPTGGFGIAMLAALLWPKARWFRDLGWRPRWWQLGTIAALILVPIYAWGRFIAARATVSNETLYGFLPPSGKKDMLVGATLELSLLHTPWRETHGIMAQPDSLIGRVAHAFSEGAPIWIGTLVFGGIVTALVLTKWWTPIATRQASLLESDTPGERTASFDSVLALVSIGTLATIILYPPALRIMNWINFGFDFPIVDRYSSAFTPLLAMLLLLMIRNRWFALPVAAIAVLTALGTVSGAI